MRDASLYTSVFMQVLIFASLFVVIYILIKSHAESGLAIHDVFTQVNSLLCENNEAGMFVTAWMGILDLETGLIRYANAGHNPPLIRRKDGTYEYLNGKSNFVLAGMEGIRYREQQLQLQQGDAIYLYTDGITEAHDRNNQLFGEDRLLASLNCAANMPVDDICKKVKVDVEYEYKHGMNQLTLSKKMRG